MADLQVIRQYGIPICSVEGQPSTDSKHLVNFLVTAFEGDATDTRALSIMIEKSKKGENEEEDKKDDPSIILRNMTWGEAVRRIDESTGYAPSSLNPQSREDWKATPLQDEIKELSSLYQSPDVHPDIAEWLHNAAAFRVIHLTPTLLNVAGDETPSDDVWTTTFRRHLQYYTSFCASASKIMRTEKRGGGILVSGSTAIWFPTLNVGDGRRCVFPCFHKDVREGAETDTETQWFMNKWTDDN